jgi:hypothetical protein
MKPLSHLTATEAKGLRGLLFDLDDTVLDEGRLTEHAYGALFRLSRAGLRRVRRAPAALRRAAPLGRRACAHQRSYDRHR